MSGRSKNTNFELEMNERDIKTDAYRAQMTEENKDFRQGLMASLGDLSGDTDFKNQPIRKKSIELPPLPDFDDHNDFRNLDSNYNSNQDQFRKPVKIGGL